MSTTDQHLSQSGAPNAGRVQALDLLRLFAALLVVLYHYTFHGPGAYDFTWLSLPEVAPVTKYFYLGVPLFFVISGFVIAYSAEGRTAWDFAIARLVRIYPGFVICMTLTALTVAMFGAPRLHISFAQWAANLTIAAPSFGQPYVDMVYWSIVCEGVFYALVTAMIASGLFGSRLPMLVAIWLLLSAMNELFLSSAFVRHALITNYSGFFGAGLMLYALYRGSGEAKIVGLLFIATLLGALQANWNADWLRERGVELSPLIVISLGIGAVSIVALCVRVRSFPVPARVLAVIGGLTYPLYLVHQMIGYVVFNRLEGVAPPVALLVATIAAMLFSTTLFCQFVERPAQRWMKRALTTSLLTRRNTLVEQDTLLPGLSAKRKEGRVDDALYAPMPVDRAA